MKSMSAGLPLCCKDTIRKQLEDLMVPMNPQQMPQGGLLAFLLFLSAKGTITILKSGTGLAFLDPLSLAGRSGSSLPLRGQ